MRKPAAFSRYLAVFAAGAVLSVLVKVFLASLGHNYDLESYELVQSLYREGTNVYVGTFRYNYGPLWFLILSGLGYLSDHFPLIAGRENYHLWVALFLSLVDLAAAALLAKAGERRAALIFLLNPLSILITGFHSQFDQLPVLFALPAVFLLGNTRKVGLGSALVVAFWLGLSLISKHCLLFFPVWLAFWVYTRNPRAYLPMACIAFLPALLFLLSFLPWALTEEARGGILAHVFRYASDDLYALAPKLFGALRINTLLNAAFGWVPIFSGYKFFWLIAMLAAGWFLRKRAPLDLLLLYTICLLVFTPALADQYLVIPALACAVYWRSPWIKAYVAAAAVFLIFFSPANLITLPALAGLRELLSPVPWRRYFAVAFLAVFFWQALRGRESVSPSSRPA